jgi:outer membrane protein OmpA-like peptidoglycan-associated protein/tetratricopeptide (TPR) repeat protein
MNKLLITMKCILISGFIFFTSTTSIYSQKYVSAETAIRQVKMGFDAGVEKLQKGDKNAALLAFVQVLELEPTFIDAYIQEASILRQLNKLEEAERAFEKAIALDADYDNRVFYGLAMVEQQLKKFEEAAQHFESYANSKNADPKMAEKAKEMAEKARNSIPMPESDGKERLTMKEPKNMGPNINDNNSSQYSPAMTADGEMMVFTRATGDFISSSEDFYCSKKVKGEWQQAETLKDINTQESEGTQCISADGKVMYFSARRREEGKGSYDIYASAFKNGKWEKAQNVEELNTNDWEALPSISADKKTLYFTSTRAGGLGGRDIWYSSFKNGKWGEAKNMGTPINTPADDQAPFIHPDGQTLYFASKGHQGLGGFDILFSHKNPDSTWAEPENLGAPLNSDKDEVSLSVSLNGQYAYFSRTREGRSLADKEDIYYFQLHKKARPQLVTYVKANVRDAISKTPLSISINFIDTKTRDTLQMEETDSSGTFLVTMNVGKKYMLAVSKPGYNYFLKEFDLADTTLRIDTSFLLDIDLVPFSSVKGLPESKRNFRLKNVNFGTGQTEPLSESFIELDNLIHTLTINPTLEVAIHGHTDNIGLPSANLSLSEKRAEVIKNYLISKGIAATRLTSRGFGETQPIIGNETSEGRASNRRMEFLIQKYE